MAAAPLLTWKLSNEKASETPVTFGEVVPSTHALVWPTYVWQKLTSPPFEDPLNAKAVGELKKFNLIWFYLAGVNRSMAAHEQQYHDPISFLKACHGFEDYIGALHQMIYTSRSIDVHVLNGIFPELGTRFQNSWRKGASLMMNACIEGSPDLYLKSKAASNEWFSWYDANSTAIESALKAVSN